MFYFIFVEIDRVVVEASVFDQFYLFFLFRGNVRFIVFVQVFVEVFGSVFSIVEVGRKGSRFMGFLLVGRGIVIVVGVYMMVVSVYFGQEGVTGGIVYGGRDKRVIEVDFLVLYYA